MDKRLALRGHILYLMVIEAPYVGVMNPLDVMEQAVVGWSWNRPGDDHLEVFVPGDVCDCQITLSWQGEMESLQLLCAMELKTRFRLENVRELVGSVNEHLWSGHYEFWKKQGFLVYRDSLFLADSVITLRQCDGFVRWAVECCQRYYPAFQYLIWAGKTPQEAFLCVASETQGEA